MNELPYPLRGDWLITHDGAELVMNVWRTAHETGKAERIALALEARNGQPFQNERRCVVVDGIAVMEIDGPLMRKAELLTDVSGATSYQWIGATADKLRADPSVRKVIIRANSPGGEAAGCGECAEKIALLAAEKYVEGYVETLAASAMYWLLSQCTHITAHKTAMVGWIGAIRKIVDNSARDEKAGSRTLEFVSEGAEEKRSTPIDDDVKERVQREVNAFGDLFYEEVAKGRGVTKSKVLADFGRGAGMIAEEAIKVGLIDAIGNFESTFAGLAGVVPTGDMTRASRARRGATKMSIERSTTLGDAPEWQCSGCNEMMGPSAKSYCAKCSEDDDDDSDEEDGDEAKALGLDVKASASERRTRMTTLVEFERDVMAALGASKPSELRSKLAAAVQARDEISGYREKAETEAAKGRNRDLRMVLERGLSGSPGKPAKLSLGAIRKHLAVALRGDTKKAWTAAMDKIAAEADASKATITAAQLVDAACSITLSAEDLDAVKEYVESSAPVAAAIYSEPHRDGEKEGADLEAAAAEVDRYADQARKVLNRNNPPAK